MMANPWCFMVGLIAILIGSVGLMRVRGYVFGQSMEGWPLKPL